jgi:hypothetical protein
MALTNPEKAFPVVATSRIARVKIGMLVTIVLVSSACTHFQPADRSHFVQRPDAAACVWPWTSCEFSAAMPKADEQVGMSKSIDNLSSSTCNEFESHIKGAAVMPVLGSTNYRVAKSRKGLLYAVRSIDGADAKQIPTASAEQSSRNLESSLMFVSGSSQLATDSFGLQSFVQCTKLNTGKYIIYGAGDSPNRSPAKAKLAWNRARAVKVALVNLGASPASIELRVSRDKPRLVFLSYAPVRENSKRRNLSTARADGTVRLHI